MSEIRAESIEFVPEENHQAELPADLALGARLSVMQVVSLEMAPGQSKLVREPIDAELLARAREDTRLPRVPPQTAIRLRRPPTTERENDRKGFDVLQQYLQEIGRYPLLEQPREVELSQLIHDGLNARTRLKEPSLDEQERRRLEELAVDGLRAKDEFMQANLRLVVKFAKRYARPSHSLELMDLIQFGNIGLDRAVDKFDGRKGFKFSTYASNWIKQAMTRGIADNGRAIRLPVHVGDKLNTLNRWEGQGISDDEIMHDLEIDEKELTNLRLMRLHHESLDETFGESSDATLSDLIGDPDSKKGYMQAENNELKSQLFKVLKDILDDKELLVVTDRFALRDREKHEFKELGEGLGVTKQRAQQIEKQALLKLKHPSVYPEMSELDGWFREPSDSWKSRAACAGLQKYFLSSGPKAAINSGADKTQVEQAELDEQTALSTCKTCPVREDCADYAKDAKAKHFIWDGRRVSSRKKK